MSYRNPLIVIAVVAMLVIGGTGVATAHDWQTEVEQGDMVIGVNTAPEEPIAGMETEFSASITDNAAEEGQANRTDWGGVTNNEVEVHINGPDGIHEHVTTHIPEDDSHFHFAYVFPEPGEYTITVVTTIDGDEYAFEFQRTVNMLPARAEGETVDNINESVTDLQQQVDGLNDQVNELQEQNEQLQTQLEESNQEATAESGSNDDSDTSLAGFGLTASVGIVAIAGGFLAGRRA